MASHELFYVEVSCWEQNVESERMSKKLMAVLSGSAKKSRSKATSPLALLKYLALPSTWTGTTPKSSKDRFDL